MTVKRLPQTLQMRVDRGNELDVEAHERLQAEIEACHAWIRHSRHRTYHESNSYRA